MKKDNFSAVLCAGLALATMSFPAPADPPPWAPAHGWRKKNDPDYIGYTGRKWERDYGVLEGKCYAKTVGTVLGGVAGGAVGSKVGDGKAVAVIVGAAIGAVIGSKIGAEIDAADRGCVGHALELAGERKSVAWTNPSTGVAYQLTPTANLTQGGTPCREFEMSTGKKKKKDKGERKQAKAVACRTGEGVWELRS